MNGLIRADTNGRIEELLSQGSVDAETTLVLANTVYFAGLWSSPFDRRKTITLPFLPLDKTLNKPCTTMTQTVLMGAYEDAELRAVNMPFSGSPDLSMVFVLPVKRGALREIEKNVDVRRLREIMTGMSSMHVTMFIPKFSFSVGGGYRAILATLGIQRAFDRDQAELQAMSATARPHLREVWHETTIEINELGGEATAATAVPADPFAPASAIDRPLNRRMLFNADHPFLFLVRHNPSGLVLFVGRYAGP
jgi:serine protease inhibitor